MAETLSESIVAKMVNSPEFKAEVARWISDLSPEDQEQLRLWSQRQAEKDQWLQTLEQLAQIFPNGIQI